MLGPARQVTVQDVVPGSGTIMTAIVDAMRRGAHVNVRPLVAPEAELRCQIRAL